MAESWVLEEIQTVDLKDKRLNRRLAEVLSQLSQRPTASIPAACGGYAEMMGAYRLFANETVGFQNVLAPHVDATRARIAAEPVAILATDTSELNLTRPEQQVIGAGPLDGGPRRGIFLHPVHAFRPDGTPLGTLHGIVWSRHEQVLAPAAERAAQRKQTPIEQKESYRWIEAFRQTREQAQRAPQTHVIYVADSEADIYELLCEAQDKPATMDWIVRACQDRAVAGTAAGKHVREQVLSTPVLFRQTIHVRGRQAKVACETRGRRQPRQSRQAEVEVRAAQVSLRAPSRPDRRLPDVTVNVVLVREVDPPAGDEPVEWLLLTSLPIDSLEQVRQAIQYYCVRWMIEVFFLTLKSGCRVEQRRFENLEHLLPCLAVYLIVAWRTLYVCRLGRAVPDISSEAVFEPAEWKSAWRVVRDEPPPPKPPPLQVMIRLVAQLGGYVNRKRTDEPGPRTVWLGLQRLHDIALCWRLFGPEAKPQARDV